MDRPLMDRQLKRTRPHTVPVEDDPAHSRLVSRA